jgi:hypothetical protein
MGLQLIYIHAFYNILFFSYHYIAVFSIQSLHQTYFLVYSAEYLDIQLKNQFRLHHQKQQNQILAAAQIKIPGLEKYILLESQFPPRLKSLQFLSILYLLA